MSSIPGLTLEDFITWSLDLVVQDQEDPNFSLRMAEAMGRISPRKRITQAEFATFIAPFEPYRDDVESWLERFDEERNGSWRDYAYNQPIPDEVWESVSI